MKILVFNRTISLFSGSGAVIHNLQEVLGEKLIVLAEASGNGRADQQIKATPIINQPRLLPQKGTRFFLWLYWFLVPMMVKRGRKILNEHRPDAILGVYPNEYFLYASWLLAKRAGLPFIAWFHNTYAENRKGFERIIGSYLQKRILKRAAHVFTISDGLTEYYIKNYPEFEDKFSTLQHGFFLDDSPSKSNQPSKEVIKFSFTGSLNSSCIEATERIFRSLGAKSQYEINIFSGTPEAVFKGILSAEAKYLYHGFLPDAEFKQELAKCDIHLVAHGFSGGISEVEYRTIFPTRTVQLLKTGSPILFHSPPHAFFTKFVKEHGCGFLVDVKDGQAILKCVEYILKHPEEVQKVLDKANQTAEYFEVGQVAQKLIKVSEGLVDRRSD